MRIIIIIPKAIQYRKFFFMQFYKTVLSLIVAHPKSFSCKRYFIGLSIPSKSARFWWDSLFKEARKLNLNEPYLKGFLEYTFNLLWEDLEIELQKRFEFKIEDENVIFTKVKEQ